VPVTVISVGGALTKLWDLRKNETTVIGELPEDIRWLHLYAHWDPIPNGRLPHMVEVNPQHLGNYRRVFRTRIDYLHHGNWPWFWRRPHPAAYAPWAAGYSNNGAEFVINVGVTNRDLISQDHLTYWANEDQVIALICRVLWGDFGDDPAGTPANPFHIEPEEERRRVDLRIARALATGLMARSILILLTVFTFGVLVAKGASLASPMNASSSSQAPALLEGNLVGFSYGTYQAPSGESDDEASWLLRHWPGWLDFITGFARQKLADRLVDPLLNAVWVALGVLLLSGAASFNFQVLHHLRQRRWVERDRVLARELLPSEDGE